MPPPVIKLGKQAGEHGSYAFYRSFQYMSKGRWRHVQLGKFFFVQVGKSSPICIGELQLVWTGRYSNHPLASIRLYYLPEQLPDGRQSHHGQDELVATEKMVLHAKDLIKWIIFDGVDWGLGLCVQPQKNTDCQCKFSDGLHCNVQVTNFNVYCRVRTALKRNEGQLFNELRKDPHSAAIYNLGAVGAADYILFCKETFENPDLDNHEYRCDHLAPNLKGRPRKKGKGKGGKVKQSVNSSAAPTLKPTKTEPTTKQKDSGEKMLKQILNNKEQFSKSLYKFMKDQGTPISKVPSLGFKKVDLFIFFKHAHNIGGYKEICRKRLWKHIYDRLGGNPHNTSAATCTKRHYERLLLSFEKHVASLTSGAAHTIHTKSTTDNCPLKTKKCLVIKDEKRVQHATSSEGEKLDDDRKSNRKHKQPLTRSESPLDAEDYIPLSRLTAIKTEKLQANSVASEIATTEVDEKTAVLTAAPGVVAAKATWSVPQACHSEQVNRVKNTKPPKKLVTKYLDSIPISSATVTKKLGSVPGPESSIAIIESRPQVISAGVKAEPKTEPEAPKLIPAHCVLKASMPLNVLGPCYPDLLTAAQQSPWKVRLYNIYPDPTFVGTDMTPDSFKITDLKRTISDNEALDLSAKRRKTIPKAHGEWEAPPSTDTCGAVDLTIDYDKPLSLVVKNKSHDRQQRQQQQDEPLNFSTPKSAIQPPPLVHRDQTRPTPPAKPIPQISTARINQHKKVHTQGYPPIQNHPHAPNPSHVPNHQQAHEKRRSSSMQLYVPARPTAAHYPKSAVITSHRMATPQYQAMTPMPVSHGQAKLNAIPNQPTNVLSNITSPSHSARPQRREDIPQKAYPVGREDIPQKAYPVGAPKQSDDRKHYIDLTRHDKQKGSSAHTMHQSPQMRQALNHTVKSAHHSPNQTMHSPKLYSPNHPTNMTRSASADKAVRHHELPPRYEDIQRHNEQLLSKAGSWSTNDPPRYREESVAAVIGIRPSGPRSETSFHRAPRPHRYSELALRHEAPNMHYDHRPGAHAAHQRNAVRSVFGRAGLVSPPYHTAYSQHTQQNSLHRPAMGSSRSKVSITSATVPHMQRLPYHQRPEATATAPQYTQYLPAPPRLQPIPSSHRTAQPASNHDVYAYDKSSKW